MSVNIAVCGKFHMHNHVRFVEQAGALNRFYYAARRSTNAAELGISPERAVNAWLKEYLIHGHCRVFGQRGSGWIFPIYHALWQRAVLAKWKPARLLHFLLHGNCVRLIDRARSEGAAVLGEPVNSHPRFLVDLLNEEHELLGVRAKPLKLDLPQRRMIEEAAASDYLIAGSPLVKRSYVEHGFDPDRFHVIPYGVDGRYFNPLTPVERAAGDDGKFRVICVAQITPRKGQTYLLEAWKQLALPNAELLLVGNVDEHMRPVLARYEGQFRHIRRVPNRGLREHYGRSSVFVLPSIEDGFAYVVAEAMGCALPVVTSVNTGAAGIVSEGQDGFVVPIRSAQAIAERLEQLYRDRERLSAMGAAAKAKAERELSWETYADRLLSFYRRVFLVESIGVAEQNEAQAQGGTASPATYTAAPSV